MWVRLFEREREMWTSCCGLACSFCFIAHQPLPFCGVATVRGTSVSELCEPSESPPAQLRLYGELFPPTSHTHTKKTSLALALSCTPLRDISGKWGALETGDGKTLARVGPWAVTEWAQKPLHSGELRSLDTPGFFFFILLRPHELNISFQWLRSLTSLVRVQFARHMHELNQKKKNPKWIQIRVFWLMWHGHDSDIYKKQFKSDFRRMMAKELQDITLWRCHCVCFLFCCCSHFAGNNGEITPRHVSSHRWDHSETCQLGSIRTRSSCSASV